MVVDHLSASNKTLAILISGNGSNLQSIIDTLGADRISVVISNNPYANGLIRAQKHNIKTLVINHRDYDSREEFDRTLYNILQYFKPNLIVLAGFMRILGAAFVQKYENRILNIHPSLLPKYKGTNTHQRVLDNNETEHGVSIHIVTPELDDGPILMQGRYAVEDGDTAEDLRKRGLELEHQMYPRIIQLIEEGELQITALNGPIQFN